MNGSSANGSRLPDPCPLSELRSKGMSWLSMFILKSIWFCEDPSCDDEARLLESKLIWRRYPRPAGIYALWSNGQDPLFPQATVFTIAYIGQSASQYRTSSSPYSRYRCYATTPLKRIQAHFRNPKRGPFCCAASLLVAGDGELGQLERFEREAINEIHPIRQRCGRL